MMFNLRVIDFGSNSTLQQLYRLVFVVMLIMQIGCCLVGGTGLSANLHGRAMTQDAQ